MRPRSCDAPIPRSRRERRPRAAAARGPRSGRARHGSAAPGPPMTICPPGPSGASRCRSGWSPCSTSRQPRHDRHGRAAGSAAVHRRPAAISSARVVLPTPAGPAQQDRVGGAPRTMASIAASAGPWPRVRAPSTSGSGGGGLARRALLGRRRGRRAIAVGRVGRSLGGRPLLRRGRLGVGRGRVAAVGSGSSRPACASPLLGRLVGARRARGLGRCARLGRRPALGGGRGLASGDVGAAVAATTIPGPVPLPPAWWPSCARSCASSSGGTSLHSPDSRLGAGDRSPWSGRGPRLSGRGPRSYERSCGAAVRPLTSG